VLDSAGRAIPTAPNPISFKVTGEGALIGVGLARLLVPAVTLTSGAGAAFPPVRVVIPLGWTALLALAIAAVPVLPSRPFWLLLQNQPCAIASQPSA